VHENVFDGRIELKNLLEDGDNAAIEQIVTLAR
jgi:hypothetical protein